MRTEDFRLAWSATSTFRTKLTNQPPPLYARYQAVSFGQSTFNAEVGAEGTPYFSRVIHFPGGRSSGVTLGPGFDMGLRSRQSIIEDLKRAGVPYSDALELSQGAGLRGESARRFVLANRNSLPVISAQAERSLFEDVISPQIIADIKRILVKPDVVSTYGAVGWEELDRPVQELLFDLRYRGDYTPYTRKLIQPLLASQDSEGLSRLMQDRALWSALGVPSARIEQRMAILSGSNLKNSEP